MEIGTISVEIATLWLTPMGMEFGRKLYLYLQEHMNTSSVPIHLLYKNQLIPIVYVLTVVLYYQEDI